MSDETPDDTERLLQQLLASLPAADRADVPRTQALLVLARQMALNGTQPGDPSRETLVRLGDRWSPLLLFVLSTGRYRHGALRRTVNALSRVFGETAVSQRMLTLRLRVLERDGLVARNVGDDAVQSVEYRLTPMGDSLMAHLYPLMHWCAVQGPAMRAAQQAFDGREG
jgi:DNA-binding HxlR family transcriptional regulator